MYLRTPSSRIATGAALAALALSSLPAAQSLELGQDFPVSTPGGTAGTNATTPHLAYNPTDDAFLAVWASDDAPGLAAGETELFARTVDAQTGALGTTWRITTLGVDGDATYRASKPRAVWNSTRERWLVVFEGVDDILAVPQTEIYWRELLPGGVPYTPVFPVPLTRMGPDDDPAFGAYEPDVTYNAIDDEYLLVFAGVDDEGDLTADHREIYSRRLSSHGQPLGDGPVRVTFQQNEHASERLAGLPDVEYLAAQNQYALAFTPHEISQGEFYGATVYELRLDAAGTPLEGTDFASDSAATLGARIAVDTTRDRYLVIGPNLYWEAALEYCLVDAATGTLLDVPRSLNTQWACTGQKLDQCTVAYQPAADVYVVAYDFEFADDPFCGAGREIWIHVIDAETGLPLTDYGIDNPLAYQAQEISETGLDDEVHAARMPALATAADGTTLVVWAATNDDDGTVAGALELRGQFLKAPYKAREVIREGASPNPEALRKGETSGPVAGQVWDPVIDHASFLPGATLDLLLFSTGSLDVPTAFGALLCTPAFATLDVPASQAFAVAIPDDPTLLGVGICTQGGAWDGVSFELTNALDIAIGNF